MDKFDTLYQLCISTNDINKAILTCEIAIASGYCPLRFELYREGLLDAEKKK